MSVTDFLQRATQQANGFVPNTVKEMEGLRSFANETLRICSLIQFDGGSNQSKSALELS